MLIENQSGQVRSTCHSLRKSNKSSVFSGKNAGKFSMNANIRQKHTKSKHKHEALEPQQKYRLGTINYKLLDA